MSRIVLWDTSKARKLWGDKTMSVAQIAITCGAPSVHAVKNAARRGGWGRRKSWSRNSPIAQNSLLWVGDLVHRRCPDCLAHYETLAGDYSGHVGCVRKVA